MQQPSCSRSSPSTSSSTNKNLAVDEFQVSYINCKLCNASSPINQFRKHLFDVHSFECTELVKNCIWCIDSKKIPMPRNLMHETECLKNRVMRDNNTNNTTQIRDKNTERREKITIKVDPESYFKPLAAPSTSCGSSSTQQNLAAVVKRPTLFNPNFEIDHLRELLFRSETKNRELGKQLKLLALENGQLRDITARWQGNYNQLADKYNRLLYSYARLQNELGPSSMDVEIGLPSPDSN